MDIILLLFGQVEIIATDALALSLREQFLVAVKGEEHNVLLNFAFLDLSNRLEDGAEPHRLQVITEGLDHIDRKCVVEHKCKVMAQTDLLVEYDLVCVSLPQLVVDFILHN